MNTRKINRQSGFSLVELLIVVLLLSIVVGALFSQIERAQVRYRVEEQRVDLTQEQREFLDQFTRDLHQAGYPADIVWGKRYDFQTSNRAAAGVWSISQTSLAMEGDVDGDGFVDSIVYQYDDGSTWAGPGPNPCPCLKRGSMPKTNGTAPWDAKNVPIAYTQVQNIIPVGAAGPVFFEAYKADGNPVPLSSTPIILSTNGTTIDTTNQGLLLSIKTIRLTFTTQAPAMDTDAHKSIQVTMTGMARLPNN